MFGQDRIAHFPAFGFVVLRGQSETTASTAAVTPSLMAALGGPGTDTDPRNTGGIRGDHLPLTVDRAPLSPASTAADPRLCQGAADPR